jgi:hypothetical protein
MNFSHENLHNEIEVERGKIFNDISTPLGVFILIVLAPRRTLTAASQGNES